jgi:hypothetical protein
VVAVGQKVWKVVACAAACARLLSLHGTGRVKLGSGGACGGSGSLLLGGQYDGATLWIPLCVGLKGARCWI